MAYFPSQDDLKGIHSPFFKIWATFCLKKKITAGCPKVTGIDYRLFISIFRHFITLSKLIYLYLFILLFLNKDLQWVQSVLLTIFQNAMAQNTTGQILDYDTFTDRMPPLKLYGIPGCPINPLCCIIFFLTLTHTFIYPRPLKTIHSWL